MNEYRRYRLYRTYMSTMPIFSSDRLSDLAEDVRQCVHLNTEWRVVDAAKSMCIVPKETVLRVCGL